MRSIRFSLLCYFLLLLALALGAVSAVVYQTSFQTLQAKEDNARQNYLKRYKDLQTREKDKLDDLLRRRVEYLANLMRWPWGRNRFSELHLFGLLTADLNPRGHLLNWAFLTNPRRLGGLAGQFNRTVFLIPDPPAANGSPAPPWMQPVKVRFAEDVLPGHAGDQDAEYAQVVGDSGAVWQRSHSLGEDELPFWPEVEKLKIAQSVFHEVKWKDATDLRIITYKAPLPRLGPGPRRGRREGGPEGRRGGRREGDREAHRDGHHEGQPPPPMLMPWVLPDRNPQFFFIQYGRETRHRDASLTQLDVDLAKDLENLRGETQASLASLRQQLLWISLATFAATVVGGFWLVRLGLSPLQRLSEAVSRVSARDFRLPLDDAPLPRELEPIAERLNQTLQMLKRAFAREKQAAADISHELRTPLAALMTTIEVALRKPRSPEGYREILEDCRASGKQMSQLVERLLALARLDAGVDTLRPREVDVAALAEQCAALVRPLAEVRGLSLRVHTDGPAVVVADPDKLREVLTNLLHNAIQYNKPEGSIDLSVARGAGVLQVEVRDTGIGIPAAAREHVFERFYRADPSRHADGLHAGLGLAIVKGYVDLMGGTIAVDSTEGEGSTFRLRLPVAAPATPAPRGERALAG